MSYYSYNSSNSYKCDNGHNLVHTSPSQLVYTHYGYSGGYICNKCRKLFENKYAYHCKYCQYDLCSGCYVHNNQRNEANCPSRHGLTKFNVPNYSFACDGCRRKSTLYQVMYGCRTCNYDLCSTCYANRNGQSKSISSNTSSSTKTCNKGHGLVYTSQSKLVYSDYGYSYGFRCDKCSRSHKTQGSYHCKTCCYDLCNACHNKNNSKQTQSQSKSIQNSSPFQSSYSKQIIQQTYSSNSNMKQHKTGSCSHTSCYCKQYVVSTSKWSKGKCKSCNHSQSLHGSTATAHASFYNDHMNQKYKQTTAKTTTKSGYKTNWQSKKMQKWTNEDALNWINSMGLTGKWQRKIKGVIKSCECTGKDIYILKNAQDVGDSFDINENKSLCVNIFNEIKKFKAKHGDDNSCSNGKFKINIFSQEKYITLDRKVTKYAKVKYIKELYKKQSGVSAKLDDIHFYSHQQLLPDYKTLEQIKIVDDKHLITVKFGTYGGAAYVVYHEY